MKDRPSGHYSFPSDDPWSSYKVGDTIETLHGRQSLTATFGAEEYNPGAKVITKIKEAMHHASRYK